MGIKGLLPFLRDSDCLPEVKLSELLPLRVCFDLCPLIHASRAVSSTSDSVRVAWVLDVVRDIHALGFCHVVFVADGRRLPLKDDEYKRRDDQRGGSDGGRSLELTHMCVRELWRAGFCAIRAPYEADEVIAAALLSGDVDCAVINDSDYCVLCATRTGAVLTSLPWGVKGWRGLRDNRNRRRVVVGNRVGLPFVLDALDKSDVPKRFVMDFVAVFETDVSSGVHGVGAVTAIDKLSKDALPRSSRTVESDAEDADQCAVGDGVGRRVRRRLDGPPSLSVFWESATSGRSEAVLAYWTVYTRVQGLGKGFSTQATSLHVQDDYVVNEPLLMVMCCDDVAQVAVWQQVVIDARQSSGHDIVWRCISAADADGERRLRPRSHQSIVDELLCREPVRLTVAQEPPTQPDRTGREPQQPADQEFVAVDPLHVHGATLRTWPGRRFVDLTEQEMATFLRVREFAYSGSGTTRAHLLQRVLYVFNVGRGGPASLTAHSDIPTHASMPRPTSSRPGHRLPYWCVTDATGDAYTRAVVDDVRRERGAPVTNVLDVQAAVDIAAERQRRTPRPLVDAQDVNRAAAAAMEARRRPLGAAVSSPNTPHNDGTRVFWPDDTDSRWLETTRENVSAQTMPHLDLSNIIAWVHRVKGRDVEAQQWDGISDAPPQPQSGEAPDQSAETPCPAQRRPPTRPGLRSETLRAPPTGLNLESTHPVTLNAHRVDAATVSFVALPSKGSSAGLSLSRQRRPSLRAPSRRSASTTGSALYRGRVLSATNRSNGALEHVFLKALSVPSMRTTDHYTVRVCLDVIHVRVVPADDDGDDDMLSDADPSDSDDAATDSALFDTAQDAEAGRFGAALPAVVATVAYAACSCRFAGQACSHVQGLLFEYWAMLSETATSGPCMWLNPNSTPVNAYGSAAPGPVSRPASEQHSVRHVARHIRGRLNAAPPGIDSTGATASTDGGVAVHPQWTPTRMSAFSVTSGDSAGGSVRSSWMALPYPDLSRVFNYRAAEGAVRRRLLAEAEGARAPPPTSHPPLLEHLNLFRLLDRVGGQLARQPWRPSSSAAVASSGGEPFRSPAPPVPPPPTVPPPTPPPPSPPPPTVPPSSPPPSPMMSTITDFVVQGLQNRQDNSCFANATLQLLCAMLGDDGGDGWRRAGTPQWLCAWVSKSVGLVSVSERSVREPQRGRDALPRRRAVSARGTPEFTVSTAVDHAAVSVKDIATKLSNGQAAKASRASNIVQSMLTDGQQHDPSEFFLHMCEAFLPTLVEVVGVKFSQRVAFAHWQRSAGPPSDGDDGRPLTRSRRRSTAASATQAASWSLCHVWPAEDAAFWRSMEAVPMIEVDIQNAAGSGRRPGVPLIDAVRMSVGGHVSSGGAPTAADLEVARIDYAQRYARTAASAPTVGRTVPESGHSMMSGPAWILPRDSFISCPRCATCQAGTAWTATEDEDTVFAGVRGVLSISEGGFIIHAQRYKSSFDNDRHRTVKVSGGLDANTLLVLGEDNAVAPGRAFELIAVVVHLGRSARSGHYVAYRKLRAAAVSTWVKIDDEDVTVVTSDAVSRAAAESGTLFGYVPQPVAPQVQ